MPPRGTVRFSHPRGLAREYSRRFRLCVPPADEADCFGTGLPRPTAGTWMRKREGHSAL
jgi:hypothetical protein